MKDLKVRDFIKMYEEKQYGTLTDQCWYDWFCRDNKLYDYTISMGKIISQITNSKILDSTYVWFKNNCPCVGPLYNDFRFADLINGKTLFTITIADKREEKRYNVYGFLNDFQEPLFSTNKIKELVDWFNQLEF